MRFRIGSLSALVAIGCAAGEPDAATVAASGQRFVQQLYDWYAPIARSERASPAWYALLDERPEAFDALLLSQLRGDSIAQVNAPGEIAGLDFDPLLNSDDPCEGYEAGAATRSDTGWDVPVYAICAGQRTSVASIVVELAGDDSSWRVRNVRYPVVEGDLESMLRSIAGLPRARPDTAHRAPEWTARIAGAQIEVVFPAVDVANADCRHEWAGDGRRWYRWAISHTFPDGRTQGLNNAHFMGLWASFSVPRDDVRMTGPRFDRALSTARIEMFESLGHPGSQHTIVPLARATIRRDSSGVRLTVDDSAAVQAFLRPGQDSVHISWCQGDKSDRSARLRIER